MITQRLEVSQILLLQLLSTRLAAVLMRVLISYWPSGFLWSHPHSFRMMLISMILHCFLWCMD